MFNTAIGCSIGEADYPEYEMVRIIISGISDILEHQLYSRLIGWINPVEIKIGITYHSNGTYSAISNKYASYFVPRPVPFELNKIETVVPQRKSHGSATKYELIKLYDCHQFRDLAISEVEVQEGLPFVFPVYDIRKIAPERIQEVRDILLSMYYSGLKEVGEFIGLDLDILKKAYEETKCESWFIEKPIGEIVSSRGKNPSKAQLVARWDPDYIYHYARISNEDGSFRDLLFMVYWRMIGGGFFNDPGRLSWIDKTTLKFIPKGRSEYRIAFKTDRGPIDFSYYYEAPQRRAGKFYSHVMDGANIEESNTVRMNF